MQVQPKLMLKKSNFLAFFLNWEKLRSLVEATLKNSKTLCELEKTWKYSLRPTLENLNFESTNDL